MMPELPEVETVRAGLARMLSAGVNGSPRAASSRGPPGSGGPAGFEAAMAGRLLERAERRGKYLWLAAGNGEALLAHLGMSGQMLVGDPDRPLSPHVRARFTFEDGGPDLRFTDQRTFGHLMIVPLCCPGGTNGVPPCRATPHPPLPGGTEHKSPDGVSRGPSGVIPGWGRRRLRRSARLTWPRLRAGCRSRTSPPTRWRPPSTLQQFSVRLRRRRTGVKRALLDQSLISGIGNIYADEALWRARLHWDRPTDTLSQAR